MHAYRLGRFDEWQNDGRARVSHIFRRRIPPVGIVYAVWSGAGIVLIAMAGWLLFGQKLDLAGHDRAALIIAGVLVINLVSKSVGR